MKHTHPLLARGAMRAVAGAMLLLAVVAFACFGCPAVTRSAQAAPGDIIDGTVIADAPLLTERNEGGAVALTLPVGYTLRLVELEGGWYAARTYVNGELVPVYSNGLSNIAVYAADDVQAHAGAALASGLQVLRAPSQDAPVIATFPAGSTFRFVRFNDAYYMARVDQNTICYLPASQLRIYDRDSTVAVSVYAGLDGASVYEAPDTASRELRYFAAGTKLAAIEFDDEWLMSSMEVDGVRRVVYLPSWQVNDTDQREPDLATLSFTVPGATYEVHTTSYGISLSQLVTMELESEKIVYNGSGWSDATRTDLRHYLNPANYPQTSVGFLQFLDLRSMCGATVEQLDAHLANEGVLAGKGAVFYEAAHAYQVNEAYLLCQAILESGHGSSALSTGLYYNPETDEALSPAKYREKAAKEPELYRGATLVYNQYGLGAYDTDANLYGARLAYQRGWTSVEASIRGGAELISSNFIAAGEDTLSGQNTLYKMLWHPEAAAAGGYALWHLYASDVGWAVKQAELLSEFFDETYGLHLVFDVPTYAGD